MEGHLLNTGFLGDSFPSAEKWGYNVESVTFDEVRDGKKWR